MIPVLFLTACASRTNVVTTNIDTQSTNQVKQENIKQEEKTTSEIVGERYDPAIEEVVATECLHAWRIATAHDKQGNLSNKEWQKLRAKDEKQAIQELSLLAKRYPSSSTVKLMMGQVKEHLGKKEDSIQFYMQANSLNRKNPMYLFKLAESLRKNGNTNDSIKYYRELLSIEPGFTSGEMGLAQSLLANDKRSQEAKTILARIVQQTQPSNSAQEAKSLLLQIDGK